MEESLDSPASKGTFSDSVVLIEAIFSSSLPQIRVLKRRYSNVTSLAKQNGI